MDFLTYLRQSIHAATGRFEIYILGPLWGWIHEQYLSGQLMASPIVWVTVFWTMNWLIGSFLALMKTMNPKPGEEAERWQPRKSLRSIGKLTVWLGALGMAWGLKKSGITGGWIPAGTLDVAVILTEFAYLVRNLGRLAKWMGNDQQGNILTLAADTVDEFAGARTRTHTEVTVTTDKVITVSEEKVTTPTDTLVPSPRVVIRHDETHSCPALDEWHKQNRAEEGNV